MQHSTASDLRLHCLLRPVSPNSYGKYSIWVQRSVFFFYCKCPKISYIRVANKMAYANSAKNANKMAYANSADPDQTAP